MGLAKWRSSIWQNLAKFRPSFGYFENFDLETLLDCWSCGLVMQACNEPWSSGPPLKECLSDKEYGPGPLFLSNGSVTYRII